MARSPDARRPAIRKAASTLLPLAAILAIAAWAIVWGEGALVKPRVAAQAEKPAAAAFAGASDARVFLTSTESREAARQGLLPPGTRSILATRGKMEHGEWRWDEEGVPAGPITIRVDLSRQLVSAFRGPDEIGTAVIVYGVEGKDTPRGKLPILGKSRDYHSVTYDAPMPFSLWLRKDGVALHGSSVSMGKATNGCIGVPVPFAEKLFAVARKGDIIEVVAGPDEA